MKWIIALMDYEFHGAGTVLLFGRPAVALAMARQAWPKKNVIASRTHDHRCLKGYEGFAREDLSRAKRAASILK